MSIGSWSRHYSLGGEAGQGQKELVVEATKRKSSASLGHENRSRNSWRYRGNLCAHLVIHGEISPIDWQW